MVRPLQNVATDSMHINGGISMINQSHRTRFVTALPIRLLGFASPLLLGLGCSPPPDPEVKTAQSAVFVPGNFQLTVTSVQAGDGPSLPIDVGLAFANLTPPPNWPSYPSQVNLGTCSYPEICAALRPPTTPWTATFSSLGQTLAFGGVINAQNQLGSGGIAGCFNFGFNTTTNTVVSLPYNSANCVGGTSGNDSSNSVSCSGSNCTATIYLDGPFSHPWTLNFTYKVTPPVTNGTVFVTPNYMIMNVYYAPPGTSSNMAYLNTTSVGTTTTISSSFDDTTNVSAELGTSKKITDASGSVSITQGSSWGTMQSDEADLEIDRATGYKISGQVNGIDHNLDEIWLLLSPQLVLNYSQPLDASLPASVSWSFVENQDGMNNARPIRLVVGWLNGQTPIPDPRIVEALSGHGVTTNDYPNILSADPLATGSPNPLEYPNRFVRVGSYNFEPVGASGDTSNPQTVILTQKTSNSSTSTESYSYSLGYTVTGGADDGLLEAKLTDTNTLTWKNSSSYKLSNGTSSMDTLTVNQPSASYQGPIFGTVYEDTIFKTYSFSLDSVCGGNQAAAQLCDNPGSNPQCVATVWGFEPGEPWSWNNSAETFSGATSDQAHSGTQSLSVSASSDPTLPASVNAEQCFSAAGGGTMNLSGKTFSAWVLVPSSSSSYDGTSCRLRAFDSSFNESAISSQAVRAPITPGAWFQLSGVFSSTDVAIYELTVECMLPTDWVHGNTGNVWYVDDIQVN